MKRLLELTDGISNGQNKEYVDADSITNIMPYIKYGFFGSETILGSLVCSGASSDGTYVKESAFQIIEMIKNKQFVLEY